ncbi:MAG: hypothetical protein HN657_02340 [Candidatus Marinimicrobia bacterium]|jgi:hypothetical protein|nr:hypothetical protein [Candidatus Neomarinimicrobiota bacterium]MBT3495607.1 hypothetical protein [Candidatus Neomarinimicrobiota bacterium]MBT3692562.1 hypothetical protein [Candidatus Neomarinimicrobiota bacterium]MBT3732497.1 hypothetical protein [Candidatus Neomarinimicrobiota bacterium]MBT4144610.1 hypothetical protein [Candidatus Neomarinimicrobiota bacterium]
MNNFNPLDLYPQEELQKDLLRCAKSIGGKNYFLQLLEALRNEQTPALVAKNSTFRFPLGTVKWTKPIFREKFTLLKQLRLEHKDGNIFPKKGIKKHKSIMNLLRALKPIAFIVQPKNKKDGEGFTFHPFDIVDEKTTLINPLFEVLFFSPVYQIKKILNKKPSR